MTSLLGAWHIQPVVVNTVTAHCDEWWKITKLMDSLGLFTFNWGLNQVHCLQGLVPWDMWWGEWPYWRQEGIHLPQTYLPHKNGIWQEKWQILGYSGSTKLSFCWFSSKSHQLIPPPDISASTCLLQLILLKPLFLFWGEFLFQGLWCFWQVFWWCVLSNSTFSTEFIVQ